MTHRIILILTTPTATTVIDFADEHKDAFDKAIYDLDQAIGNYAHAPVVIPCGQDVGWITLRPNIIAGYNVVLPKAMIVDPPSEDDIWRDDHPRQRRTKSFVL